ncbi:substrate-binding domain-containing protein [Cohnella herbarum]|uniref:GntR family transcriptional regulator n=1 Tax=Cohnella herbarum TaxID=2728023 RepID=A0A7Z2VKQ7_9BACL|nr:GntR family transcriptional regulator [Cohnella herbarum]QJD84988.1 GntR family transcriptional regulator [Cohnella herbarum]
MEQFTPTYYQIKQSIKKKIADGKLNPGDILPGRVALSEQYECSWSTLNRAVNELILEGVLTAEKGKGTYVSANAAKIKQGIEPVSVWFCNPYPSVYATLSEMMDGLRNEANDRGRAIQFIDNGNAEAPANINGYIVITPSEDQVPFLLKAWAAGQRFVVLNSDFQNVPFSCVNADLYQGSTQVIDYLLDKGHQRIGLLGLRDGQPNYRHRQDAFRDCFKKRGLPFSDDWFVGRPENLNDAHDLFSDWVDRHPECTAIFAADYMSTLTILETLVEKDIEVPVNLSLFASGYIPFESLMRISLSTMVQPFYEIGRMAMARLLDEQFDRGTELLPCRVIYRESINTIEPGAEEASLHDGQSIHHSNPARD